MVTTRERGRVDAHRKSMVRVDGTAILDRRRVDCCDGRQVSYRRRSHRSERVERKTVDVYASEYVDMQQ
jgi:hypothetical protein